MMLIAVYDSGWLDMKRLVKMLKKALPSYKIKGFTSKDKLAKFVINNDVAVVFLEKDRCGYDYQIYAHSLRRIKPRIDFVLVSAENADNVTASWAIDNQVSGLLPKPVEYDRLLIALAHIWYHKIPEYDAGIRSKQNSP